MNNRTTKDFVLLAYGAVPDVSKVRNAFVFEGQEVKIQDTMTQCYIVEFLKSEILI